LLSMSYRLFIGQLIRDVRRREIEDAFSKFGEIARIDIKNGFGFVEYEHSRDAEEAIRKMDGEEFLGRRIIVEYARGGKRRERGSGRESRTGNNTGPERSDYRVIVEGLGRSTSWQDLKDAFRSSGDILFTDVRRDRYQDYYGIVEFRHKEDIEHAIRKMDGAEVNGHKIRVKEDRKRGKSKSPDRKGKRSESPSKDRRSPTPSGDSKPRERRSRSKDKERSLSKERERERSEEKEKERERRSGSRDSKPRDGSEDRDERKRSRSPDRDKAEDDKEREPKRAKQDDDKEPEKDEREDN